MSDWIRVFTAIDRIAEHRPLSDEEFAAGCPIAVAAARSAAKWLRSQSSPIPSDVFALPDGGVMFEWGCKGGDIMRFDFAPGGRCQGMTTYADGREATFVEFDPPLNHL